MANHHRWEGPEVHLHHNPLDVLTIPVLTGSVLTWSVMPWAGWLWEHFPTPTMVYMGISAVFMLFQMSDKLGWLERFKKRELRELQDTPDNPGT